MNIERSKNVLIRAYIPTTTSVFSQTIDDVDFDPDVVIVRQLTYQADPVEDAVYQIISNLVSGGVLGTFYSSCVISSNIQHMLHHKIGGSYQIQIEEVPGTPSTTAAGIVVLNLEFIKYKTK